MERGRRNALCIALGSAAVFCASIVPMAFRIGEYNANAKIPLFHAEPLAGRTLRVSGFPIATLTDVDTGSADGQIRLSYGDKETLIPVKRPAALNIPDLSGYDEWLKPLVVYPVHRDEQGQQRREAGSERFVIAVRRTPEGFNPETWGEVRRIDWVFDFYNLKPDGTLEKTTRRWPRSYKSEARLKREATGEVDDAKRVEAAKALIQYEPLQQRTLEYYVAMFVIPKLNVPEYKFTDTAFSPQVLGWTLPCSMIAALAFTGSFVFVIAPRRRTAR